jgi:DNA (cytosine-5)-methyltransferase 1
MATTTTTTVIRTTRTTTYTPIKSEKKTYKFIDLFCGIGGFHQALTSVGIGASCVFACDIDENCRKVYEQNYHIKPEGDITKINIETIPPFNILCAGFPCQSFSKAGSQKGFDDSRGNLFFNICNIVRHHRPEYLLLENVKNLTTHDDGNTWDVIYKHIVDMGYSTYIEPVVLNVLHFNIPQNRERVIIICKRNDDIGTSLPPLPIIPKNPKQRLTRFIKDIALPSDSPETIQYKLDGKMKAVEYVWDQFIKLLIHHHVSIPKFPIWTDWWDKEPDADPDQYQKYTSWIDKNKAFYQENRSILQPWLDTSRACKHWTGAVRKFEWQAGDEIAEILNGMKDVLWTARGSGIRVKKLDYIPTLVAMSMIPVYGPESRKLSPRELLRLQSFPDSFIYDEKTIFKQVGNAVNVTMIERCARFLIFGEELFI